MNAFKTAILAVILTTSLHAATTQRADWEIYTAHIWNYTHSMGPLAGKDVWLVRIPFKDLRVGMIVQYANPGWFPCPPGHNDVRCDFVIHRIVRKNMFGKWVTKGDNNDREDPTVITESNYQGTLIRVIN
jgi:hypothetical protein